MKRIFAIFLTVTLIFATLSVIPVSAAEGDNNAAFVHYLFNNDPKDLEAEYDEESMDSYFETGTYQYRLFLDSLDSVYVKLNRDCTTKYFPQFRNSDVNIDLNGHTWTVTEAASNCVSMKDITISGGTLIFKNSPSRPIMSHGGKITVRNVIFKDCECGKYGVICSESTQYEIDEEKTANSTNVYYNTEEDYYTDSSGKRIKKIKYASGEIELDNVRFENCSSTAYGGCIYTNSPRDGKYTFNNCKFNNCKSEHGGVCYFEGDNCNYNFVNCEFNLDSATVDGGGIYCMSETSKVHFTNCNAYRCHADDCGGFIFCSGKSTVYNGSGDASTSTVNQRSNIIGCYALDSGGAFYSSVNANCSNYSEVRNFNMAYNTAGASEHKFDAVKSRNSNSWGGAVCFRGTDMKLCFCDLYSNYANWYGGAVYCGYRRTSVENCSFYENRCSDAYGNDIYLDSNNQYVTGCTFYTNGNSVAGYDAAKWSNNTTSAVIKRDLFTNNEIEDGDYIIYTALNEKMAVDIEGGKNAVNVVGANAHLWESGEANVFNITKDKNKGTYVIKSKVTGLVLDVSAGSKDNGANIQQWESNDTDAQRWVFESAGNGCYYIRCVGCQYMDASGMVDGAKPTNGVNIQSWEFTGATNQQFKLVKVSGDTKNDTATKKGDGSKENPYKISSADEWKTFAINVLLGETYEGKYIELTNDIPISYVPVGNFNAQKPFKGTLDGKNHTIHYLDSSEDWDRGLFSFCQNATIENLRVTGKTVGTISLAGICAGAFGTTFKNCINDSNIESLGENHVAGISAKTNSCKFINCTNNGEIHGGTYLSGGIAALTEGESEFIECRNNGRVYASNENVGGIVGEATANITVKQCVNNAPVESGNVTAGGIVGCVRKGANIISCVNTDNGVISSKQYSAGMIGWTGPSNENVNINNCANCGEIKVTISSGSGIAFNDSNNNMTVNNCFNATTKIPNIVNRTVEIAEGDYLINSVVDERYSVEISGGKTAVNVVGANAHLWENGDAEVFTITKDKDKGTYIIKSKVTGLVLDVSGGSKDDGANIQQWESNGSDAQRWVFEPAGNGCYYIRCVGCQYMDASGMVNGAKPTNGVNIQSWSFTGATNQQFKLVDLSGNAVNIPASTSTGAIAPDINKGKYTNCYYLAGGASDKHATALSPEDCGNVLKAKMNMYIAENITNEEMADWAWWQTNPETNVSLPDLENVYEKYITGGGTATNPFLISNAKGLKEFARNIELGIEYKDKYFRLTENFAYTGKTISSKEHPFTGIFDGNGHTITAQLTGQTNTALFGVLDGGTVKNLKVDGFIQGAGVTAAIVGKAVNSRIDNCIVTASVVGADANTGGIVGIMDNSTVSNCRMDGKVTSNPPVKKELADSNYIFYTSLNEKKSVDIEDGIHSVNIIGKSAHLWENGEANVFAVTKDSDKGTYIIKSTVTGLVLDVSGASKENGVKIQQWEDNGSDAQRWSFVPAEEEGYYFIRCEGGQYMEVKDSGTDNGTKIQSSEYTGAANQKFKLVDVLEKPMTGTGGIVGNIVSNGKIINCVNSGKITGNKAVGGIAGCVTGGDPMIINCSSIGSTAESTKGKGVEHGGIVGYIGGKINTMTVSNCFTSCTVGVATDSGYIVGNNQKADKVSVDRILYKKYGVAKNILGMGNTLTVDSDAPITLLKTISDATIKPLNNYAANKVIDGIALTSWKKESLRAATPKSYVDVSSFTASVFSSENLAAFIIIGAGLIAAVVGITVLYRKKKKSKQ